ncbi:DUF4861 domain-containing protein [Massilia sp. TW-1]|uniref:DUF4861 domain-containing protein n=2 Tax=Telluria antibiotica TaxID=2717319 RepID=A0ABX0P4J6_9BURK|nr:DUF4861 domain-containing protein [Telluria antibiotica]
MQANFLFCAAGALLAAHAVAADRLTVTASHDLDAARPSETIVVPWRDVNAALPGALIQHLVVKDAAGHVLPYQVTNVAPLAKDPQGVGAAYGELLFQHDFAPGERTATFVVEKSDALTPPFAPKAFARYVPERLDDFAWENDVIGHRTYGPALAAPAPPGSGKEVLETSGLDIWFKRVDYPVVDRWYNKGHDHYHKDEGEGMDMYNVGRSRGAGGTGVWDGGHLAISGNYATWKVLANGPVRTVFELTYDAWDAAGTKVEEVKRFTVDAGHQLDQVDSTFTFAGPAALTVAVGLNKTPADKKQAARVALVRDAVNHALLQWVEQATNGAFGTAIVLPPATGYADDALNDLVLARVESGRPLRYWVGAAWDRAGRITSKAAWQAYVAAEARRIAHPVRITVMPAPH